LKAGRFLGIEPVIATALRVRLSGGKAQTSNQIRRHTAAQQHHDV
jgi:hypothetical protein